MESITFIEHKNWLLSAERRFYGHLICRIQNDIIMLITCNLYSSIVRLLPVLFTCLEPQHQIISKPLILPHDITNIFNMK